jgi:hypothetical protein
MACSLQDLFLPGFFINGEPYTGKPTFEEQKGKR